MSRDTERLWSIFMDQSERIHFGFLAAKFGKFEERPFSFTFEKMYDAVLSSLWSKRATPKFQRK
jgi:uncharacterized glyoxalase superfamily metalloenzyme YdcJ